MFKIVFKMDYFDAMRLVMRGLKVQRQGWNGKGMFVFMTFGREIPLQEFGKFKNGNSEAIDLARKIGTHTGDVVRIQGHVDLLSADGSIVVGWNASQSDIQAADWVEVV